MKALTPAAERAGIAFTEAYQQAVREAPSNRQGITHEDGLRCYQEGMRAGLAAALDVKELTEVLAREQWNRLPLVTSEQMPAWDDEDVAEYERQHFRDGVRPYAQAIVLSVVGAPT